MRWAGHGALTILQNLQNHLGLCNDDDVDDDHEDDGVEQINIEISFFSAAAGLLCAAMG